MERVRIVTVLILLVSALTGLPVSADTPKRVLVAGATGQTGVWVVKQLLTDGIAVRGLVRDYERAAAALGPDVELVVGDVRDPASLAKAFDGVTHAVSVIGSRQRTGPNSFEFVDWEGNRNLIDAAMAARVRHFVLLTSGSAGIGSADDDMSRRFGAGRIWKGKAEAYLRASGLSFTVVAPGGLRDYAGGEKEIVPRPRRDYRIGVISREDVANVIVACVDQPACDGKTITIINGDGPANDWLTRLDNLPQDSPETISGTYDQLERSEP